MAVRRDFATWPVIGVPVDSVPVTFAGTTSPAIDVAGRLLAGINVPVSFAGTALTFQNCADGTNYQPVKDPSSGSAISWTVAANGYYAPSTPICGLSSLKLVSNASETVTVNVCFMP